MPVVGQLSSTRRSFGPGAYAPTDDAYTSVPTPAAAVAANTRALPSTFTERTRRWSRAGWISQARWTTASAPWKCGRSGELATSAARHSSLGKLALGTRRHNPSTDSTAGSSASERSRLVPTLPLAPVTTTRTARPDLPWRLATRRGLLQPGVT